MRHTRTYEFCGFKMLIIVFYNYVNKYKQIQCNFTLHVLARRLVYQLTYMYILVCILYVRILIENANDSIEGERERVSLWPRIGNTIPNHSLQFITNFIIVLFCTIYLHSHSTYELDMNMNSENDSEICEVCVVAGVLLLLCTEHGKCCSIDSIHCNFLIF